MLFFPFYTVLFWYLAGKYRRTWKGLAAVILGLAGFVTLEILLIRAGLLGLPWLKPWPVLLLMIPMGFLATSVAIFIWCLPNPPPYVFCRRCRYDLTGLDPADLSCPECGAPFAAPSRCPYCRHDLRERPIVKGRCPECEARLLPSAFPDRLPADQPPAGAHQQHEHREPRDQHPPDQPELPLT